MASRSANVETTGGQETELLPATVPTGVLSLPGALSSSAIDAAMLAGGVCCKTGAWLVELLLVIMGNGIGPCRPDAFRASNRCNMDASVSVTLLSMASSICYGICATCSLRL